MIYPVISRIIFALFLLAGTTSSFAADDVDITWGVKIPMSDGVQLNGTLYQPRGTGPLPVILTMSPYISDTYHRFAMYYAQHGYTFLAVDVRGRGNSSGEFHPFYSDTIDGPQVVNWIAGQAWSNGKVAMWGGSYGGMNQWATARSRPQALKSIVPVAPAYAGVDFPPLNNIFRTYTAQWLAFTSGKTGNSNLFGDFEQFWTQKYLAHYRGEVRFRDFDSYIGFPSAIYQKWMANPQQGGYYDTIPPTEEEFAAIDIPVLGITGHYDGDQPGTFEFYRRHNRLAPKHARDKHFLIVGPWDHGATRVPRENILGVSVGDKSLLDISNLHREWYDWTLKDGDKPGFLRDKVAYFVVGANKWKYASSLDGIADEHRKLYLDAQNGARLTAFASGYLNPAPPQGQQTVSYADDPLDWRMADIDMGFNPNENIEQRDVLALHGDGLVYHTAAFEKDTEITGRVDVVLWMSMNVTDTDFRIRLYEILADGSSVLLSNDLKRARYRESWTEQKLVKPDSIARYHFDRMMFFSRMVGKGSRLRLVIDGNNTIRMQQNFNSGGVVADETTADAKTAVVTVHQDRKHRSYITLPIVKGD